ncbi:hypothetical protein HMPREF9441_02738 [Paraprevotella clara YIT 11840]|uniref:Uncharacterized protein n=1 Tax=Paraprevotella clara YIT 11840 TaxID=762968 RepID=G5STN2_9BACT|nr:hypothetical protein HMPREF9441_02738 [Paraprevotella clara YIT 11840]
MSHEFYLMSQGLLCDRGKLFLILYIIQKTIAFPIRRIVF